MAKRYEILYGDNDFELRRELPSDMPHISAAKCTVTDDGGTALQSAASVTVPTATTLGAAIAAGAAGGTMQTAQPWVEGDLLEFGNAGEVLERRRIRTYTSATGVFTTTKRFNAAHANGVAVKACWWTYSLDASGTGYGNLERGTILWGTFTPDDTLPFTDEFVILNRAAAPAAVQSKFAVRFPHVNQLAETFEPAAWRQYEKDAQEMVRWDFANKGRVVEKMADSGSLDELRMLKVAYLLALGGGGEEWADEIVRLRDAYNERLEMFVASPFWTDDDQDGVMDEGENADAQAPFFMGRNL